MEKEDNLQLELFTQSKDASNSKVRGFNKSFLAYIWNYEKIILIIIAIVITGIVSFSLGVEKGKRLAMLENNPAGFVDKSGYQDTASPKEQKEEVINQPLPIEKENYVIQLASYKIKTHAQKEVELLKKKGFSPLILSKGSYIVLCVGNFSNKQTARSLLSELKKRYRDCYITRL